MGELTYFSLLRRLKRAMSAINHVFLSATPFNRNQLCHVFPQLCMLELSVDKDCQVHKLMYAHRSWRQLSVTVLVHAHRVCALESSSFLWPLELMDRRMKESFCVLTDG